MLQLPRREIERLLQEDAPSGDLTTQALGLGARRGRLTMTAREPMIVAGLEIAAQLVKEEGAMVGLEQASGARVAVGETLLFAEGPASALHLSMKTATGVVETMSGIATATARLVAAAQAGDPETRVATTRKAFPGARRLSQIAVQIGGGLIHRHGLSETVLVFREHRVFAAHLSFDDLAARLRREAPEKKLAIEVDDGAEAEAAITAGFDIIQLEKMTPDEVARVAALAATRPAPPLIVAAGGVTPDNAGAYARAGAKLLVTSWPYAARPADVATRVACLK